MTPDLQVECPFCGCDSLVGSYGGVRLKCEGCGASAPAQAWLGLAARNNEIVLCRGCSISAIDVVGFACRGCNIGFAAFTVNAVSKTGQIETMPCANCGAKLERIEQETSE